MLSKKLLGLLLVVSLTATAAAHAADNQTPATQYAPRQHFSWFWFLIRDPNKNDKKQVKAPEIDPATAFSGLTLLAGGLAVIRGRRLKK